MSSLLSDGFKHRLRRCPKCEDTLLHHHYGDEIGERDPVTGMVQVAVAKIEEWCRTCGVVGTEVFDPPQVRRLI